MTNTVQCSLSGTVIARTQSGRYLLDTGDAVEAVPVWAFHKVTYPPDMIDERGFLKEGSIVQVVRVSNGWLYPNHKVYSPGSLSTKYASNYAASGFESIENNVAFVPGIDAHYFLKTAQDVAALNNAWPPRLGFIYVGFDERGQIIGLNDDAKVDEYAAALRSHLSAAFAPDFAANNLSIKESSQNGRRYFQVRVMPREGLLFVFGLYLYARRNGETVLLKDSDITDLIVKRG